MKQITHRCYMLLAFLLATTTTLMAQNKLPSNPLKTTNNTEVKTYVIERQIPGAGKLTAPELKSISQTSCAVLKEMGPKIEWVHSYVTGDKIFCIYKAQSIELVKEHAKKGGFPANSIMEVATVISPATAD